MIVAQDREAVFPTRQSLGIMKAKLKGAETGHSLLKRKSEALTKYGNDTALLTHCYDWLTLECRRFRGSYPRQTLDVNQSFR